MEFEAHLNLWAVIVTNTFMDEGSSVHYCSTELEAEEHYHKIWSDEDYSDYTLEIVKILARRPPQEEWEA